MSQFKQWICIWIYTLAMLSIATQFANAGWIYDLSGVMAPTLENPVSASFTGEIEFPGELSTSGELRISLTNEFDLNTGDPIVRTAPFSMSANMNQPIGMRLFNGTWNDEPFAMQWMDWQSLAQDDFDASTLTGGGEWDAWGIGFVDYQLGSITDITNRRETPQVSEPGGLGMALIGGLVLMGLLREKSSGSFD